MARLPTAALLLGLLAFVAACGAATDDTSPVVIVSSSPDPTTTPSPTAVPSAIPTTPAPSPTAAATPVAVEVVRALADRFPEAATLLGETKARSGVAVIAPDHRRYAGGDDGTFALASVAKVPIMVATLQRAHLQKRALTSSERGLLEHMITISSNDSTDTLWSSLGGGVGVDELLAPLGVTGIEYAPDHQWGDTRATPSAIAELLAMLVEDDSPLDADSRAEALGLMQSVVADQRWGASAGVDLVLGSDATLAIKDGWYPETTGWLLNSAAIISVHSNGTVAHHVLVILTDGAETQTDGVREIETLATAINQRLVPPALVSQPTPRTFTEIPLPGAGVTAAATEEATPEPIATAEPEPEPVQLSLVPHSVATDVLVPSGAVYIGSEAGTTGLRLWYRLATAQANELLGSYTASMQELGWSPVIGPPSVVLAKSSEDRWVGLSAKPEAAGGRLLEFTISPAPDVYSASSD
jgi:hypothetical protein